MKASLIPCCLVVLAACSSSSEAQVTSFPGESEECVATSTPMSESSWSGPTEEEVLVSVGDFTPTRVTWDQRTLGAAESALVISVSRTADAAQIVERSMDAGENPSCRAGPELVLSAEFDVTIDGGHAAGTLRGTLAVAEDGTAYVDAEGPAVLSQEWEDAANADIADRYEDPGSPPEWRLLLSDGDWQSAEVGIGADGDYYNSALWSGHWSEE